MNIGNKILYAILVCWVKAHAILPMRLLYLLSDFLYFITYYVARYRLKVVGRNLKASFPEKSRKEMRKTRHPTRPSYPTTVVSNTTHRASEIPIHHRNKKHKGK